MDFNYSKVTNSFYKIKLAISTVDIIKSTVNVTCTCIRFIDGLEYQPLICLSKVENDRPYFRRSLLINIHNDKKTRTRESKEGSRYD